MKTLLSRSAMGVVLFNLFAAPVMADFTGDVKINVGDTRVRMHYPKHVAMKPHFLRMEDMEIQPTMIITLLVDSSRKKTYSVNNTDRTYLESPLRLDQNNTMGQFLDCYETSFDSCAGLKSYKKVGHETYQGHSCDVFEKTGSGGTISRIYHPLDFGGKVPLIREVELTDDKKVQSDAEFVNIKTGSVSNALFAPPAGYRKTDMSEILAKMPGMNPEKMKMLQEMMKRRQQQAQ